MTVKNFKWCKTVTNIDPLLTELSHHVVQQRQTYKLDILNVETQSMLVSSNKMWLMNEE